MAGEILPEEPPRKRVLMADTLPRARTLESVFGGHAIVDGTTTFNDAVSKMAGTDLILGEICFDGSRMFDLLDLAKANPRTRSIPFVCYRGSDSVLGKSFVQSIEIACVALGSAGFVDFFELESQLGVDGAYARLRDILFRLLFTAEVPVSVGFR